MLRLDAERRNHDWVFGPIAAGTDRRRVPAIRSTCTAAPSSRGGGDLSRRQEYERPHERSLATDDTVVLARIKSALAALAAGGLDPRSARPSIGFCRSDQDKCVS